MTWKGGILQGKHGQPQVWKGADSMQKYASILLFLHGRASLLEREDDEKGKGHGLGKV